MAEIEPGIEPDDNLLTEIEPGIEPDDNLEAEIEPGIEPDGVDNLFCFIETVERDRISDGLEDIDQP